jgi:hypothetical protein
MNIKNTLIVGMALLGALALLTGTFVTLPAVLAIGDPNEKSYGDPKELPGWDPNGSPKQHCIGCIEYFAPGYSDPK